MRQWHLMVDPPMDGVHNMAVDEALLTSVASGDAPPTLRLYAWSRPYLSLGYAQSIQDVDCNSLDAHGWGLVRRMTGGRAILHTDELTYSLALPKGDPLALGGIIESYRRISQGLLAGINPLATGLQADKKQDEVRSGPPTPEPVCFVATSHYEITTLDGRKLIGSAQTRRRDGLLQHGTLPLTGDLTRICDVLHFPSESDRGEARQVVRSRAATLEEVLSRPVSWQDAADLIVQGFVEIFDIEFTLVELTDAQRALAAHLAAHVYRSDHWNKRL